MKKIIKGRKCRLGKQPEKGVLNEISEKRCVAVVADVKSNIGGEDEIFHLYEQWKAGVTYLEHSIFCYLAEETNIERHVMVITRSFDDKRIHNAINTRRNRLKELERDAEYALAARKVKSQQSPVLAREIVLLEDFVNRRFIYKSRGWEINSCFEVLYLQRSEDQSYYEGHLKVEIV